METQQKYFLILALRAKQAYRIIREAGIFMVLLAFFLIGGLLFNGLTILGSEQSIWAGIITGLVPLGIHFYRNDLPFLAQLNYRLPLILFLEYTLASLPFFLLFILYNNWSALGGLSLLVILSSILPDLKHRRQERWGKQALAFIPLYLFELRFGVRARLFYFILMGTIGLATPWLVGLLPVIAFFLLVLWVSFFDHFEPKEQIEQQLGKGFLQKKIGYNFLAFQVALTPYYLLFLIFHGSYWYFIPIMMLYAGIWISFAILYKYANYSPYQGNARSSTLVGIFGIMALIPYLLPVNLMMLVWYRIKALQNLRFNAMDYVTN